jgi:hypothetical protein
VLHKNSNLQIIKVVFNIVITFKITSISEFGVLRIHTNGDGDSSVAVPLTKKCWKIFLKVNEELSSV